MGRTSLRRLLAALGGTLTLLAAFLAAASPAAADSLLQHKQHQLHHARRELRRLDNRAELLTERYDHAVSQLQQLNHQIHAATRRLIAARIELAHDRAVLAGLLVSQYKGGKPQIISIVLGASSLNQVTTAIDTQQRFDTAVSNTVSAIDAARQAIAHERLLLRLERRGARARKREIAHERVLIKRQLRRRQALIADLGQQVQLLLTATTVNQGKLALQVRQMLLADMKLNANDPGQQVRDQVALEGLQEIGVPYVWGGASPTGGFDCSGLTMWLWAKHGVSLPHFAASQFALGPVVEHGPVLDESKLRPGDLLFFHELGHVGIYLGSGLMLHAPHTGTVVQISHLSEGWFQSTFVGATEPGGP
jgi:cell wall-associated NlpC family hydrolase